MKTYTFGAWILVDANGKDIRDSEDTYGIPPDFFTVIDYSDITESFNTENRFKDKIEKENPGVIFCYGNVV